MNFIQGSLRIKVERVRGIREGTRLSHMFYEVVVAIADEDGKEFHFEWPGWASPLDDIAVNVLETLYMATNPGNFWTEAKKGPHAAERRRYIEAARAIGWERLREAYEPIIEAVAKRSERQARRRQREAREERTRASFFGPKEWFPKGGP